MSRLQGSSSSSSSASHLPLANPAQCESHIWDPSKADSAMPLLPLTRGDGLLIPPFQMLLFPGPVMEMTSWGVLET